MALFESKKTNFFQLFFCFKVAALIVIRDGETLTKAELKEWAAAKLPAYAFPTVIKFTEILPKNAMGKVNKKELIKNEFIDPPAQPKTDEKVTK